MPLHTQKTQIRQLQSDQPGQDLLCMHQGLFCLHSEYECSKYFSVDLLQLKNLLSVSVKAMPLQTE